MKSKKTLIILFFIQSVCFAQNTIGLLFNDPAASEGYTLFTPLGNNEVYLINNCGEKVNQWTFTEKPGATCYLLPNGNLLRAGKDNLEIRNWNNVVLWSYATTINGIPQHHDIEPLPNGNILCLVTDTYSLSDMVIEGRNPLITDPTFKLDKIVELQPVGTNNANIVWEWKFIDHFIQDYDATKQNFGVVENHPELIDLNFANGYFSDYTHVNAIDYNADLDQIMLSTRHLNEIHIIDHSTTTLQAAGHSGGNSNKGGDFLWRWGNPQVYKQGTAADKKLFLQHDCKWIENGYLDAGKISVFNNGGDGTNTFSSIHIITPEFNNGIYTKTNNRFNPQTYEWSWNGTLLGVPVNEVKQSGVQSLSNGNMLICETSSGRISEVTKAGVHLWSYKNPTGLSVNSNPTIYTQSSILSENSNGIFRAQKYPPNYIGFTNQNLTSQGIIENINSLTVACTNALSTENFEMENLYVFNSYDERIEFNKYLENFNVIVYDIQGRVLYQNASFSSNNIENINASSAVLFIKIQKEEAIKVFKIIH